MRARVLGTLQLESDLGPVIVPTGKVRTLLELLLLESGETLPSEAIIAELWPGSEPADAATLRRLHTTVSRTRRLLGDDADDAGDGLAIVSVDGGGGYRLEASASSLDRIAFDEAVHAALSGPRDPSDVEQRVEVALSYWRGEPFTGFAMTPEVLAERERLYGQRRRLLELRQRMGGSSDEEQLLAAKLHRPRVDAATILRRPRLLDPLPRVGDAALIAISAPAGYGKSVLLSQWAAEQPVPTAWVGLDGSDGDASRFWREVRTAIDLAGWRHLDGLDESVPRGSVRFLEALAECLGGASGGLGIVVDDLDVVGDSELVDQLAHLVSLLPGNVTLAVASRGPLDALVGPAAAAGRVHVVAAGELRFDEVETARMIAAAAPVGSTENTDAGTGGAAPSRILLERTGGWPVAVASLLRAGQQDVSRPSDGVLGTYLVNDVLPELPSTVRDFLVATAHLDRLHRDLCGAVTRRDDAGEMLAWLRRHDLFIVEADADTSWYRYHDLVRDELRRHVELETDADLREFDLRAARWYLAHGLEEEALHHAARSGDRAMVAELAGKVLLASGLRGEPVACRDWLAQLDPDDLATDPRSHSIAMFIAAVWLSVPARGRWVRSRLRHFGGDDDVALTYVRAVEAADQGRASESVQLTQRVLDEAWTYGQAWAGDLIRVVAGSALTNMVLARLLQGTLRHDDPLLPNTVALLRPEAPLLAAWIHLYWSLAALVDGEMALAASLVGEFTSRTEAMAVDGTRAPTTIVGAVLEACETTDPARLKELADQLTRTIGTYERLGADTRAAIVRYTAACLYGRAGDGELAAEQRGRAEVALRTFDDAPFVMAFRDMLDGGLDGSRRTDDVSVPVEPLTARELAVLAQLATRRSMAEIATDLHISLHTVRAHTRAIYRKLVVSSRHEAVVRARELGL